MTCLCRHLAIAGLLLLGVMGVAVGVGASISTTMAGVVIQHWGYAVGF